MVEDQKLAPSSKKTAGTQYIPTAFQVWLSYVME